MNNNQNRNVYISINCINRDTWGAVKASIHCMESNKIDNTLLGSVLNDSSITLHDDNGTIWKTSDDITEYLQRSHDERYFIIIYNKLGDERNFSELIPFFAIKDELAQNRNIEFRIDISNVIDKDRYYYSCSQFLFVYRNERTRTGMPLISFSGSDYGIRGIFVHRTSSKNYASLFSPLIEITEENKRVLFDKTAKDLSEISRDNPLRKYIENQLFNKPRISATDEFLNQIEYKNLFAELFIKSFYLHLHESKDKELDVNYQSESNL